MPSKKSTRKQREKKNDEVDWHAFTAALGARVLVKRPTSANGCGGETGGEAGAGVRGV
jgi:hypothetical protein